MEKTYTIKVTGECEIATPANVQEAIYMLVSDNLIINGGGVLNIVGHAAATTSFDGIRTYAGSGAVGNGDVTIRDVTVSITQDTSESPGNYNSTGIFGQTGSTFTVSGSANLTIDVKTGGTTGVHGVLLSGTGTINLGGSGEISISGANNSELYGTGIYGGDINITNTNKVTLKGKQYAANTSDLHYNASKYTVNPNTTTHKVFVYKSGPADDSLPAGALISIIAGFVVLLGAICFIVYWFLIRKKKAVVK